MDVGEDNYVVICQKYKSFEGVKQVSRCLLLLDQPITLMKGIISKASQELSCPVYQA